MSKFAKEASFEARTAKSIDREGNESGSVALKESIFGRQPNVALMHQVVVGQLAGVRAGTQSTKTRAEVAGGGAKPYRQKGTGRARQGSTRAPHFMGGGVALGPKPRSYRQKTPKKMVAQALWGALSDRAAAGKIFVIDGFSEEKPSTKAAASWLSKIDELGSVLLVVSSDDEVLAKSFRNLPQVEVAFTSQLSAYLVLVNEAIVFTPKTLESINGIGSISKIESAE